MAAEGSCAAPRHPRPALCSLASPGAPRWAATLTSPLFWQLPFQDSPKQ